jgi:hypothetical protein
VSSALVSSLTDRPATPKPDDNKCWDPGGVVHLNEYTSHMVSTALIAAASDDNDDAHKMSAKDTNSRTELDSHANMVVVGNNCLVIEWSGRTAVVNPFTPEYEVLPEVPIVDAAVMYECPNQEKNTFC